MLYIDILNTLFCLIFYFTILKFWFNRIFVSAILIKINLIWLRSASEKILIDHFSRFPVWKNVISQVRVASLTDPSKSKTSPKGMAGFETILLSQGWIKLVRRKSEMSLLFCGIFKGSQIGKNQAVSAST